MKKILNYILLLVLVSISIFNASASDVEINWEESKIYSSYSEENEKLKLKYSLFVDKKIKRDYTINMKINEKEYSSKLEYKSFMLKWECEINIKKLNIKWLYKL